ncbi:unnamed protein product [Clonostachys rosea]|uniref:Beta-xylanase n=1 Tax=Bionectria ochroleuca TaxID=29856 RepID=A0ABY6U927_BIOOC|nr:unnamed protein product [Clonostachys rosea]
MYSPRTFLSLLTVASAASGQLHGLAVKAGLEFFGTALGESHTSDSAYISLGTDSSEFGQLTPENGQKWDSTESSRGQFSYTSGDIVPGIAAANGQILRCHTLTWHSQLPSWVSSGGFSYSDLQSIIETHIANVVGHYAGACHHWDVVNEAADDSGSWRSSVFYNTMGTDFLAISFNAAKAADPNAKLYLNDYNLEYNGAKTDRVVEAAQIIQNAGAPIDGVGFQGHLIVGSTPSRSSLATALRRFTALGLEVAYTEVDIRHSSLPASDSALVTQGNDFANVVGSCLDVDGCVGVTVWGVTDKYSWIPDTFPGQGAALLYDDNLAKKPAWTSVSSVLAAATAAPGYLEKDCLAVGSLSRSLVHAEVALALKLKVIALLKLADSGVADCLDDGSGVWVEAGFEVIVLVQGVLGDEVVKVPELGLYELALPGHLLLGSLEITLEVQLELELLDGGGALVKSLDDGIAPRHESELLARLQGCDIGLLHPDLIGEPHLLGTDRGVLGVLGSILVVRSLWAALKSCQNGILLIHGIESWYNGVEHLLVESPDSGPVHCDDIAAGALLKHKLAEGSNSQTSSDDTTDSRHTRVIPPSDLATVDDLGQLTLGKEGLDEVDTGELPQVYPSDVESVEEPVVLLVSVGVLGGTEGMGHALETINNWAGEVICGIDVPCPSSAVVWCRLFILEIRESVNDRVSHRAVAGVESDASSDAMFSSILGSLLHLFKDGQETVHAVLLLDLGIGVVGVGVSGTDHFLGCVVEFLEIVAGIGGTVDLDSEKLHVLFDTVLILLLFFDRVC